MKKLLVLLWLLLALILPACTSTPTYDELIEESQRTGDTTKVEAFEDKAAKAVQFYENKTLCMADQATIWVCRHQSRRRQPVTIDERVRAYQRERADCGCVVRDNFLDSLGF